MNGNTWVWLVMRGVRKGCMNVKGAKRFVVVIIYNGGTNMKRTDIVDMIDKLNKVIDSKEKLSKGKKALLAARNYLNYALTELDWEHYNNKIKGDNK